MVTPQWNQSPSHPRCQDIQLLPPNALSFSKHWSSIASRPRLGRGGQKGEYDVVPDMQYLSARVQYGKQTRRSPGISRPLAQYLAMSHSSDTVYRLSKRMTLFI